MDSAIRWGTTHAQPVLMIPGPTELPFPVVQAMNQPATIQYDMNFDVNVLEPVTLALRDIFQTRGEVLVMPGSGRTALALKAEYDLLLTQRLVLTPEIEASVYGKDDKARRIGAGLSDASFSLRLRYEITREVAPYVGVSFGRKFGKTASYASEEGESRSERAIMAGVRIWF